MLSQIIKHHPRVNSGLSVLLVDQRHEIMITGTEATIIQSSRLVRGNIHMILRGPRGRHSYCNTCRSKRDNEACRRRRNSIPRSRLAFCTPSSSQRSCIEVEPDLTCPFTCPSGPHQAFLHGKSVVSSYFRGRAYSRIGASRSDSSVKTSKDGTWVQPADMLPPKQAGSALRPSF